MLDRPRLREILELTRLRLLTFVREPEAVFWVFVFPVVLAVVLGFAFRETDPEPSRVAVLGDAALAGRLAGFEGGLEIVPVADREQALRDLRRARIDALVLPGSADEPPTVRFDPKRPEAELARERVLRALEGRPADGVAVRDEPATERGSRYIDFLFAGLLGMNLMGTGVWGTGFAIADMRQKKLIERLVVTPMRRSSMLVSFVTSRLVFLVAEVAVLLTFGLLILDVPMRGSLFGFAALCLLGGVSFSGLGILLASRAKTIEGVSGLMNFAMMPMWLFSGVFFSYERFPEWLHPVLRLLPLTALSDALRDVMLDGESLLRQGPEVLVLLVWLVVCFAVALRIFRWR